MIRLNRYGDSPHPCLTPTIILNHSVSSPSTLTALSDLLYMSSSNSTSSSEIPQFLSICHSPCCHALSKGCLKSMQLLYNVLIFSKYFSASCLMTNSWSIVPPSQSSLQILYPASEAEVSLLLNSLPNKQCELDPIPTSLLKDCASVLLPVITKIINLSLFTGNFPVAFKHSLVTPLLKKAKLDKENLSNYRPLSNLSFLSKLTQRIVLARLNNYLSSNSLLNLHQSGFTKHHSTGTLLVSLYNKLVSAVSHQQVSCLCLLDISAAFDTIDHNIFLQRLSSWFGVSGTTLLWFQSYLSTRSFSVKACSHSSQFPLSCGVPQGSILLVI